MFSINMILKENILGAKNKGIFGSRDIQADVT